MGSDLSNETNALLESMKRSVKSVGELLDGGRERPPTTPGLYAFWWLGNRAELGESNRKIVLSGPAKSDVEIELKDWWPTSLPQPCLYVGKSTKLRTRIGQHVMQSRTGRMHRVCRGGRKQPAVTTTCQLRYGIEHLFPEDPDPVSIIRERVGVSFAACGLATDVTERFYLEDLMIGLWRPWLNVDSER